MSVVDEVVQMKSDHEEYWRDRTEEYWFCRLMGEVGELAMALVGEHEDSPDWELKQIASICMNWLEMREDRRG